MIIKNWASSIKTGLFSARDFLLYTREWVFFVQLTRVIFFRTIDPRKTLHQTFVGPVDRLAHRNAHFFKANNAHVGPEARKCPRVNFPKCPEKTIFRTRIPRVPSLKDF